MRCPACRADDTKVVDSRTAQDGAAIRRRRLCLSCGHRFTTFERMRGGAARGDQALGRSGCPSTGPRSSPGVRAAAKGRPVERRASSTNLAIEVEDAMRLDGPEVTSAHVGVAVLDALRDLDEVAYLRFASVYKGFDDAADFERELTLLAKGTPPKRH